VSGGRVVLELKTNNQEAGNLSLEELILTSFFLVNDGLQHEVQSTLGQI
jgi:hypothetical protein